MDTNTKTRQDAFARVAQARVGSLAEQPTDVYLESLREFIYGWVRDVERKLATDHIERQRLQDAIDEFWSEEQA